MRSSIFMARSVDSSCFASEESLSEGGVCGRLTKVFSVLDGELGSGSIESRIVRMLVLG